MTDAQAKPGFLKTWFIAVRPFAYTASVLSVALGLAMAYYHQPDASIRWLPLAATLLGVVFFHTAANLLNDCFDFKRGLDVEPTPVSGGVVRGFLTARQAFAAGMIFLALGAGCGVYLYVEAGEAGWVILLLGLIGTFIALAYTTAGLCLKFMGLGDLALFAAFGVLPVFGTFWVQTREFHWLPILWSVPLVLYTVGMLHANNWRDIGSDPAKGCRTMASMLGERGSAVYYRLLVLGPFAIIVVYFLLGLVPGLGLRAPLTVLAALLPLPLALKLVKNSRNKGSETDPMSFVTLDGQTAKMHTVFGALLTIAFFVGKHLPILGAE